MADDGQRALSLKQERQLAGVLAVLSSIREDVNLVTAVAAREVRTPEERHHTSRQHNSNISEVRVRYPGVGRQWSDKGRQNIGPGDTEAHRDCTAHQSDVRLRRPTPHWARQYPLWDT